MRQSIHRITSPASGFLVALVLGAVATAGFPADVRAVQLSGGVNYKTVVDGETGEFVVNLLGAGPGSETIDLTIELHHPMNWFAQFCQVSTGICYFEDAQLVVSSTEPEEIRVDLFTEAGVPGVGWVRLIASDANDPTDRAVASFTVFSGTPVDLPSLELSCGDYTVQTTPGELVEFNTPIRNLSVIDDNPFVVLDGDIPGTWFAQFCETTSGICYFDDAEVDLTPTAQHTLRVDVFTAAGADDGLVSLEIHSGRNPSFYDLCLYRVFTGAHTADVTPTSDAMTMRAWAQPNPFRDETDLRFTVPFAGPVQAEIFSADGRRVRAFGPLDVSPGAHGLEWDGRDDRGASVPAGAYFYQVRHAAGSARGLVLRMR